MTESLPEILEFIFLGVVWSWSVIFTRQTCLTTQYFCPVNVYFLPLYYSSHKRKSALDEIIQVNHTIHSVILYLASHCGACHHLCNCRLSYAPLRFLTKNWGFIANRGILLSWIFVPLNVYNVNISISYLWTFLSNRKKRQKRLKLPEKKIG